MHLFVADSFEFSQSSSYRLVNPVTVRSCISGRGATMRNCFLITRRDAKVMSPRSIVPNIGIASSDQVQRQQRRDEPVRENTHLVLDTLASRLRSYHLIIHRS